MDEEQKQNRSKLSRWNVVSDQKPLAAMCLQELKPLARFLNTDMCGSRKYVQILC